MHGNEGIFDDRLWVQEFVHAVEISHRERRWVTLPLDTGAAGGQIGHDGQAQSEREPGRLA